jgi:uncharacterized SAM-binding protein YcdF (DUF218 family)
MSDTGGHDDIDRAALAALVDGARPPADAWSVPVEPVGPAATSMSTSTPVGGVPIVAGPAPGRRGWRLVVRALVALVLIGIVYYLVTLFQVWIVGRSDQARPVDAIVVMGAAQYDGRPSPELQARLDHVVLLWNRGLAPLVVTTGGKLPGDRFTEAEASTEYLVAHGVPRGSIVRENAAHNSYDSLAGVAALLQARGLRSVLLVSDPFHSLRIRLTAQELALVAAVSPTRTSPVRGATELGREAKEAAGIALGRVIGFKRLLSITG